VAAERRYCPRHEAEADLERVTDEVLAARPVANGPPGVSERAAVFEERLADRNYRALFDARVIQVMTDAAEHLEQHGLGDEIGALRFVLARLLAEEEDLSRLAGNVSRVVSVAVAAAKAQRAINGEVAHGLVEAFTQILLEVNDSGDVAG
jgi:hypothetical protein